MRYNNKKLMLYNKISNMIHSYGLFHDKSGEISEIRDKQFIGKLWNEFYLLDKTLKNELSERKNVYYYLYKHLLLGIGILIGLAIKL